MSTQALDLLLRVLAEQLGDARCPRCGAELAHAELQPRGRTVDAVVVDVACAACGHVRAVEIKPEGG